MDENFSIDNSQVVNNILDNQMSTLKSDSDKITLYDINSPKPVEDMPYIYCPKCQSRVVADSAFCSSCGYKLGK